MSDMTPEQAVEVLARVARAVVTGELVDQATDKIDAALAALDGKHVYASRFRPGDEYWHVMERGENWSGPHWFVAGKGRHDTGWDHGLIPFEADIFPTRAEAEAAAERRFKRMSPYIENVDELVEDLANMVGVYDAHDDTCTDELPCRVCWVVWMRRRIMDAVAREQTTKDVTP